MASAKSLRKSGQVWLTYAALILLGILVGHAFPSGSVAPSAVSGTVSQVTPGATTGETTFWLAEKGKKPAQYQLTGSTSWQNQMGPDWKTNSMPSCLTSTAVRTASAAAGGKTANAATQKPITIGVVTVQPSVGAKLVHLVFWVKCEG